MKLYAALFFTFYCQITIAQLAHEMDIKNTINQFFIGMIKYDTIFINKQLDSSIFLYATLQIKAGKRVVKQEKQPIFYSR